MVQSNVMVTYAPARKGAAPVAVRDSRGQSQRRRGMVLAGTLLAGGAVFALGTFVRPDGTVRDTGAPLSPGPQAAAPKAGLAIVQAAPEAEAEPRPLPYLALVRKTAPLPAPSPDPAPAIRTLSAPAASRQTSAPPRAASGAYSPSPASAAGENELVSPPAPPPAGLRRDLQGFLNSQGLELAVPEQTTETIEPVSQWSADDLAMIEDDGAPSPADAPAIELTATSGELAADPGLGDTTTAEIATVAEPPARLAGISPEESDSIEAPSLAAVERLAEPAEPVVAIAPVAARRDDATPLRLAAVPPGPAPASVARYPAAVEAPAYVQHFPLAVVNGETLGAITLRELGPHGSAIHLGALVGLLKLHMPQAEFTRLSTAAAADRFVTLEELREAGIVVRLDERQDRLFIEAR